MANFIFQEKAHVCNFGVERVVTSLEEVDLVQYTSISKIIFQTLARKGPVESIFNFI